jgi:hypothetical protein
MALNGFIVFRRYDLVKKRVARCIVSFRELEIYFPFRFVSFQKIMRFLRFVSFRS